MELFRGYVKTKDKKCMQKFGNGEKLLTLEQAQKLDEYAGVIANDVILIDVDTKEEAELLMDIVEALQLNCRVYQTTKGKHFYFKNTRVNKCNRSKLACGLTADIKVGLKNSYGVIKMNGKERFIEWEEINNTLDELPAFLLPIKSEIDFLNMENGDGRNQTLFNYILTLQKYNLTKEEIKTTLRIINKFILKDKLDDRELETIMRDESFPTNNTNNFFNDKGQFRFDEFAKFLINEYKIIKINGQLHIFKDGVYTYGFEEIQAIMINHISHLNKQKRSEVMSYLDLLIREDTRVSSAEWIAFKNGIYNIETEEFKEFTSDIIITNRINYNYVPNAYSEIADKTLNKLACHKQEIRNLLEEVIGYCFYRRNELRKSFLLTGEARGGKSSYLNMITQLIGSENSCALDLKELGDRFKTAEVFGKLAVIGDDIGDEFIPNPAIFKKVVSGDRINAERKGQNPFDFSPYAKLLFSANTIPRIKDKSGAVIDRLIIVPFNARFSKNDADYDPFIKYKLQTDEVMEYLINIGLQGLNRVLKNQSFTICEDVQKSIQEYEENNNPILLFFKETEESDVIGKPTKFVYQNYVEFCLSNNFQQLSNIEFSKQVKKHYGCEVKIKNINGKSTRCFEL